VSFFIGPTDRRHLVGVVAGIEISARAEQQIHHRAIVADGGNVQRGRPFAPRLNELRVLGKQGADPVGQRSRTAAKKA
jgi:hypothetical protein